MANQINLGMEITVKLTDWTNEGKHILHISDRSDYRRLAIWGDKHIKELRDFLNENFPEDK